MLLILLGGFAWSGTAAIPEKYQTIIDRNAFGLNPPAPVETNVAPVTPPANVKLAGIAETFGQTKAYFMIQPKDPKEQTQYINLSEGQREGVLEVTKIMKEDGEVRIRNTGVDMVLSFKNNGVKAATLAPGMMPAPPAPLPPGGVPTVYTPPATSTVVAGGVDSKVVAGYTPPGGMPQPGQPGNPLPTPNPSTGTPSPPPLPTPATPSSGIRTIPTRTLRVSPSNP